MNRTSEDSTERDCALVVDLDGTLTRVDTLWESWAHAARLHPTKTLAMSIAWLMAGRAVLKRRLCELAPLPVQHLPYRSSVVSYIEQARAGNRQVFLVTAADQSIASAVSAHLGLFDASLGSTPGANLKGRAKLPAIRSLIGARDFDYIGDSSADVPIWANARRRLVVGSRRFAGVNFHARFDDQGMRIGRVAQLLRPHQWLKNALVFLPVILAHRFFEPEACLGAFLAFLAMSACASAVYVLNDVLDLASDRVHSKKRNRPIACGEVGIPQALFLGGALLGLASIPLLYCSRVAAVAVASYLAITTLYSLSLKRIIAVDVLVLASLYSLRVVVGGVSAKVALSPWLLAFCMFLFLSLALAKRYAELSAVAAPPAALVPGRGYRKEDAASVGAMGIASGFISVLVFTLYINGSSAAMHLYPSRGILWLIAPIFLFWIMRLWIISYRGEMNEDPVVFAAKDRTSWVLVVGVLLLGWMASLPLTSAVEILSE